MTPGRASGLPKHNEAFGALTAAYHLIPSALIRQQKSLPVRPVEKGTRVFAGVLQHVVERATQDVDITAPDRITETEGRFLVLTDDDKEPPLCLFRFGETEGMRRRRTEVLSVLRFCCQEAGAKEAFFGIDPGVEPAAVKPAVGIPARSGPENAAFRAAAADGSASGEGVIHLFPSLPAVWDRPKHALRLFSSAAGRLA